MKIWDPRGIRRYLFYFTLVFLFGPGCAGVDSFNQETGHLFYRNIDGTQNNLDQPTWGAAGSQLKRMAVSAYGDGISSLAGADWPNPRLLSNQLMDQLISQPNDRGLSSFVWQWGQFVDHDIDLTPDNKPAGGNPGEAADVPVPQGDPWFDPLNTGQVTLAFFRSVFDGETGLDRPREQITMITAWIDGSQVYGSDDDRALWLRTGEGGKLKEGEPGYLPWNDGTQANAPDNSTLLMVGGDVRANEQVGLLSLHVLFFREHNRLAAQLQAAHSDWTDEEIYQRARKIVGATLQAITFNEFLPALLGPYAPGPYGGYDPTVDPSILNEFSAALYRFGHSMVAGELLRLQEDGSPVPEGPLALREAFFDPIRVMLEGGIDPILRGLAAQRMEEVDCPMVEDLRNFLFGPPGAGGLDLAALNMQRGRDHGLPDYNTIREAFGLTRLSSFQEITSEPNLAQNLENAYGDPNKVDVWAGSLAEDHLPGSSLGELLSVAIAYQFGALRDGDRFWYENDGAFTAQEVQGISQTRLSDIIRRNTQIQNIPDNVFVLP